MRSTTTREHAVLRMVVLLLTPSQWRRDHGPAPDRRRLRAALWRQRCRPLLVHDLPPPGAPRRNGCVERGGQGACHPCLLWRGVPGDDGL
jgi:hypothetical protein